MYSKIVLKEAVPTFNLAYCIGSQGRIYAPEH